MEKFIKGFEKLGGLKDLFGLGKKNVAKAVSNVQTRVNPRPNWDPYGSNFIPKKRTKTKVKSNPKPGPTLDYSGGTVTAKPS